MTRTFRIKRAGAWVDVSAEEYAAHRSSSAQSAPSAVKPGFGLGDAVAAVATPIARALKLSCIDPATQQLRPDSGCAKRKAALNRLTQ